MPIAAYLDSIARISAAHIVNTAVGSLLLALIAWAVLRLLKNENAGTRFAIWTATLCAIAALPLTGILLRPSSVALTSASSAFLTLPAQWALYLFFAWAVIAGAMLLKLAVGLCQLRRVRSSATEIDIESLDALPRKTLDDFRAIRPVSLCTSDAISVPTAIGFFRPAVLLPSWAPSELAPADLNSVLLHELAHLRRRDDWTNLLQKVLRAVFFFSPAVWWIESRLSLEREMACDEHVLASEANPRAYAECLVNLAERGMLHRAMVLAQGAVHRLRQCSLRITRILESAAPASLRIRGFALTTVGVATLSSLALLAHAPDVVGFRSTSSMVAKNATAPIVQLGEHAKSASLSNEFVAPKAMLVNAAWKPGAVREDQHLLRSHKQVAHRHQLGDRALQRIHPAGDETLPVYHAGFASSSVPATVVVVTERSFLTADGAQVWTMSVYRFAVLPRSQSVPEQAHSPKRI